MVNFGSIPNVPQILKSNNMNTIGVIGVAVAIGTVLAAFGALYFTWWLAGSVDEMQDDIKINSRWVYRLHDGNVELFKQIEALKTEITNLNNQINELKK